MNYIMGAYIVFLSLWGIIIIKAIIKTFRELKGK